MNDILSGKKTYIIAALIGLVAIGMQLNYISMETAEVLYGILGAGGLAALRIGVASNGKKK